MKWGIFQVIAGLALIGGVIASVVVTGGISAIGIVGVIVGTVSFLNGADTINKEYGKNGEKDKTRVKTTGPQPRERDENEVPSSHARVNKRTTVSNAKVMSQQPQHGSQDQDQSLTSQSSSQRSLKVSVSETQGMYPANNQVNKQTKKDEHHYLRYLNPRNW